MTQKHIPFRGTKDFTYETSSEKKERKISASDEQKKELRALD